MLDRIVKISSLGGALLVFFGVLKLILFYLAFNVKIVDFLSFSEIVTSFLDDINLLIVFIVVMSIQSFPIANLYQKKAGLSTDQFYDLVINLAYSKKVVFVSAYLMVLVIVSLSVFFEVVSFNYVIVYIIIFSWFNLVVLFLLSSRDGKVELPNGSGVVMFSLVVGGTVVLLSYHDIVERKENADSVVVYLEDGTIISCGQESSNIYLGKTEGYIFIAKEGVTTCIPVNEMSRIDFEN